MDVYVLTIMARDIFVEAQKKKQENVSKETVRISYIGYGSLNVDTLKNSGNYKKAFSWLYFSLPYTVK